MSASREAGSAQGRPFFLSLCPTSTSGSGRPALCHRPSSLLPSSEESRPGQQPYCSARQSGDLALMAKTSIICHVTPKFGPLAASRPPRPAPPILHYLGHLLRDGIKDFTFQTGTWSPTQLFPHCNTRSRSPRDALSSPCLGYLRSPPPHPVAHPAPDHQPLHSMGHKHKLISKHNSDLLVPCLNPQRLPTTPESQPSHQGTRALRPGSAHVPGPLQLRPAHLLSPLPGTWVPAVHTSPLLIVQVSGSRLQCQLLSKASGPASSILARSASVRCSLLHDTHHDDKTCSHFAC